MASLLDKLKKRAIEEKDPYCMIELGLIYCGEDDNTFASQDSDCASVHGKNPDEGLRLVLEGVELGEAKTPNPIMFTQYSRIGGYYLTVENFLRKTGDFANQDDRETLLMCLSSRASFFKKALESAKNGGGLTEQELAITPITHQQINGLEMVVNEAVNDLTETLNLFDEMTR